MVQTSSWWEGKHNALLILGLLCCGVAFVRFYSGAVRDQYSLKAFQAPQIDLNLADEADLVELPGIGKSLARKIIEERDRAGPFVSGRDLCERVDGIGDRKLEAMLEYAYISS